MSLLEKIDITYLYKKTGLDNFFSSECFNNFINSNSQLCIDTLIFCSRASKFALMVLSMAFGDSKFQCDANNENCTFTRRTYKMIGLSNFFCSSTLYLTGFWASVKLFTIHIPKLYSLLESKKDKSLQEIKIRDFIPFSLKEVAEHKLNALKICSSIALITKIFEKIVYIPYVSELNSFINNIAYKAYWGSWIGSKGMVAYHDYYYLDPHSSPLNYYVNKHNDNFQELIDEAYGEVIKTRETETQNKEENDNDAQIPSIKYTKECFSRDFRKALQLMMSGKDNEQNVDSVKINKIILNAASNAWTTNEDFKSEFKQQLELVKNKINEEYDKIDDSEKGFSLREKACKVADFFSVIVVDLILNNERLLKWRFFYPITTMILASSVLSAFNNFLAFEKDYSILRQNIWKPTDALGKNSIFNRVNFFSATSKVWNKLGLKCLYEDATWENFINWFDSRVFYYYQNPEKVFLLGNFYSLGKHIRSNILVSEKPKKE